MAGAAKAAVAPSPTPEPEADEASVAHYAAFELDLLHHAITVADAKASFVLGIAVAFAVGAFQPTVKAIELHHYAREAFGLLGEAILMATGAAAYLTVAPRIVRRKITSNTYWGSPAFLGEASGYIAQIRGLSQKTLEDSALTHLHVLAQICRHKYARLNLTFYTAPLGLLMLAASYLAGPNY